MSTDIITTSEASIIKGSHLRAFSSIQGDDLDTKQELMFAVMGAAPLADNVGVPFDVAHIVRQPVLVKDEVTGEESWTYRTTLVGTDGSALAATSKGIDVAVDNILATLGNPSTWGGRSFPFVAERVGSGKTAYLTIKPVRAAKR